MNLLLNFEDFKDSLRVYEIEGGFGSRVDDGVYIYYTTNDTLGYGHKFSSNRYDLDDLGYLYAVYLELYSIDYKISLMIDLEDYRSIESIPQNFEDCKRVITLLIDELIMLTNTEITGECDE